MSRFFGSNDPTGAGYALLCQWAATPPPPGCTAQPKENFDAAWDAATSEADRKPTYTLAETVDHLKRAKSLVRPHFAWPEFKEDKDGKTTTIPAPDSRANVEVALGLLGVTVYYDEFSRRYRVEGLERHADLDVQARRSLWFKSRELGLKTTEPFFKSAVLDIAASDRRHPVRQYLEDAQTKWDRQPRVENWLTRYVGAEDTPYTRAVAKLFLVAAVRRVRRPGVKYDYVTVLVGPQDAGKSSVGMALVPVDSWFEDGLVLGSETKIVLEQTAGKWIMEINEMRGGKETEAIKAMITRTADTARKAYAEDATTVPRQFVMMGTTDKDEFLNDPAGNRRYLPIEIGQIDLDGLRRDRDQLWAEAATIEASNEIPRLVLPPDVREAAKEVQRKHEKTDPIYERIAAELGDDGGQISLETLYAAVGAEQAHYQRTMGRRKRHKAARLEARSGPHRRGPAAGLSQVHRAAVPVLSPARFR